MIIFICDECATPVVLRSDLEVDVFDNDDNSIPILPKDWWHMESFHEEDKIERHSCEACYKKIQKDMVTQ